MFGCALATEHQANGICLSLKILLHPFGFVICGHGRTTDGTKP
jgi:hypothetical protein